MSRKLTAIKMAKHAHRHNRLREEKIELGDNLEITFCVAQDSQWFELTRSGEYDVICFEVKEARALMRYLGRMLSKRKPLPQRSLPGTDRE